MIEEGALEEVRGLVAQGLDDTLPIMRALGVRPLVTHLQGKTSLTDAIAATLNETRAYAKRQRTWLRRNMIAWQIITTQQIDDFSRDILAFIDR
jgi:tRNA dimethylallyltransferase